MVVRVAQGTSVSVVNVNRNDGRWNRNVNSLGNDNVWNRDNRLVVGDSALSPALGGSFLFNVLFPSNEHFARLHQIFRELGMLRICKHFHLPSDNEKEFCKIEPRERCFDGQ